MHGHGHQFHLRSGLGIQGKEEGFLVLQLELHKAGASIPSTDVFGKQVKAWRALWSKQGRRRPLLPPSTPTLASEPGRGLLEGTLRCDPQGCSHLFPGTFPLQSMEEHVRGWVQVPVHSLGDATLVQT